MTPTQAPVPHGLDGHDLNGHDFNRRPAQSFESAVSAALDLDFVTGFSGTDRIHTSPLLTGAGALR